MSRTKSLVIREKILPERETSQQEIIKHNPTKRNLTRKEINIICDSIPQLVGLDRIACEISRKNIVAGIRKQLYSIQLVDNPEAVSHVMSFIGRRSVLCAIDNDKNVGFPMQEAIIYAFSQLLQDAFKSTDKDVNLGAVTEQIKSVLDTVKDRSDQKVIVHLDRDYAPFANNFSLREASDMRGIFVGATIRSLLSEPPTEGVLGSMGEKFDEDTSREIMEERNKTIEEYSAPVLLAGQWNKLDAIFNNNRTKTSVVFLRLKFNLSSLYERMLDLATICQKMKELLLKDDATASIAKKYIFIPSSLSETTIDIFPPESKPNRRDGQILELRQNIYPILDCEISGLAKVSGMFINRISIFNLIKSFGKANVTTMSHLGMMEFINTYDIKVENENNTSAHEATWSDIENNAQFIPIEQKAPRGYFSYKPTVDEHKLILPKKMVKNSEREVQDERVESFLTDFYLQYFLDGRDDSANAWILTMDTSKMRTQCIDTQLVTNLLEYCGIAESDTQSKSKRSGMCYKLVYGETGGGIKTNRNPPTYIYIFGSVSNPQDIVKHHLFGDTTPSVAPDKCPGADCPPKQPYSENWKDTLSDIAKNLIDEDAKRLGLTVKDYLPKINIHLLSRVNYYYFVVLECSKKNSSKDVKGPYIEHVMSHVYSTIINYPFVDRFKTTCNDWNTMTFCIGAEGAGNNYIIEPSGVFSACGINIDPRHMKLLRNYVFEKGIPAGVGLTSAVKHGQGIISEVMIQAPSKQIIEGTSRKPESISNIAVAQLQGQAPIPFSQRAEYVAAQERRNAQEKERVERRYASKFGNKSGPSRLHVTEVPKNKDTISLAVRSMLIDYDPYYSIDTIQLEDKGDRPKGPDELIVEPTNTLNYDIIDRLKQFKDQYYEKLRNTVSIEVPVKKKVVLDNDTSVFNITEAVNYLMQYRSIFSM